jgi:aminoglycoside 3-N-acetyltransferase I
MTDSNAFQLIQLTKKDTVLFGELITLFKKVFEDSDKQNPSQFYLEDLLSKTDFFAIVVLHNDKVIGGVTGYELQKYYKAESEFFIYDLAVDPSHQRLGIATRLLEKIKEICYLRQINSIFVDAHSEDHEAIRFYESLGHGQGEEVTQFTIKTI